MTPEAKVLERRAIGIAQRIGLLERKANGVVTLSTTRSKPVWGVISQPVMFKHEEFQLREGTYVNGAEDLYIDALTYHCYMVGPPVTGVANQSLSTMAVSTALSVTMANDDSDPDRTGDIDFRWNYRVEGAARMFLPSSSEGDGLVPRTMLGYPEMGQFLRFPRPLRLRASESITFMCKPTLLGAMEWAQGSGNSQDRFVVDFIGIGYRTGATA